MEKCKLSKYNTIYDIDGTKILLNNYTGSIIEIESNLLDYFNGNKDINLLDSEYLKIAKEQGFAIDDNVDEEKIIKMQYLNSQFNPNHLGLVIAPTLECNFACPYCFETRVNNKMSEKIQDDIVSFVEEKIINGVNNVDVTWYGGEPLIYKDVIENITSKILKLMDKYNFKYKAYIITNGYLVKDNDAEFFQKNIINGAQITIDGPADIHNKRRILKNGNGTFDIIIKNIKKLLEFKVDVSIRVNVDKTNSSRLEELLQYLNNEKLNNCRIALGHVQSYTPVCKSVESFCVNKKEFRNLEYDFAELLLKYNFINPLNKIILEPKTIFCGAVMKNYYVIDPDGYLYKCWNDIGNSEKIVGKINEVQTPKMIDNESTYLCWNPTNILKCQKCKELPNCMGGCPFMDTTFNKLLCEHKLFNFHRSIKLQSELGGDNNENN